MGAFNSNNSNTRTLSLGSGTVNITATAGGFIGNTPWNIATGTNLTLNRGTGTIKLSRTSGEAFMNFDGGGKTYPAVQVVGSGSASQRFIGSNTFKSLSVETPPLTVNFTAATTTTVEDAGGFFRGTSGNVITIGSITSASHTLSKTGGGSIFSDFLSISRSDAIPANTWYAGFDSTNGGDNSGWLFEAGGINAAFGNYALNAQAANLQKGRVFAVDKGDFTLSGQATTLNHGYLVSAAKGDFALNGQAVTFTYGKGITAAKGDFALNGQAASFVYQRKLAAQHGAFALSGFAGLVLELIAHRRVRGSASMTKLFVGGISYRKLDSSPVSYRKISGSLEEN
jgi:hypothetical protein